MVQIDHRLLEPAALQGVLKDLAVRQGLDYGVGEMPLENQIQHLHNRLESASIGKR